MSPGTGDVPLRITPRERCKQEDSNRRQLGTAVNPTTASTASFSTATPFPASAAHLSWLRPRNTSKKKGGRELIPSLVTIPFTCQSEALGKRTGPSPGPLYVQRVMHLNRNTRTGGFTQDQECPFTTRTLGERRAIRGFKYSVQMALSNLCYSLNVIPRNKKQRLN